MPVVTPQRSHAAAKNVQMQSLTRTGGWNVSSRAQGGASGFATLLINLSPNTSPPLPQQMPARRTSERCATIGSSV